MNLDAVFIEYLLSIPKNLHFLNDVQPYSLFILVSVIIRLSSVLMFDEQA